MKAAFCLLFTALTLLISSCDRTSTLTYKVKNMGADSIRIITVRKGGNVLMPDTLRISYNQTITIGQVGKGSEHISNYRQSGTIEDFQSITIYKIGSGRSAKTNFLQASLWEYTEKSARMADYTLTVKDSDF